jgi:surfeit locus 1 family protein
MSCSIVAPPTRLQKENVAIRLNIGRRRFAPGVFMTLLTLAAVLLFLQLGRWQWHRAAEKARLLDGYAAATAAATAPLGDRSTSALPRYARISVTGRYDAGHQFLLDNMIVGGRVGYEVLTPMDLADGRTLLVNRGWVALPGGGRTVLPRIELAGGGEVTVAGMLDNLPVPGIAAGRGPPEAGPQWPKRTGFPQGQDLAAALGRPVEARQLLLAAAEPLGYVREWHAASDGFGPDRHLSYAVQWWAFAALALVLYVALNLERVDK